MSHILDRPVWNALNNAHAIFAEGDGDALRYRPSIVPFAAPAGDRPQEIAALGRLLAPGEAMVLVEAGPVTVPDGLTVLMRDRLVQMLAEQPHAQITDSRIEPLTEADAPDMLALALLTKPGPFTLKAQSLGTFWGVKIDGRLVAMAGQRMRQPAYAELSGLCTHPDFQGRGLGKLLLRFVAGEIAARGETVYLHSYAGNTHAIALYEALGFRTRSQMNFAITTRPASD
jgi:ribosomal protein S18 acetylase RimI-like enzyme